MTYFVHYRDANCNRVNSVLHLCTSNDANGNPRRLIVCVGSYGHVVATFDEDLNWGGLYQLNRDFASWTKKHAVQVNVTVSEYNRWRTIKPDEITKVTASPELPAFQ